MLTATWINAGLTLLTLLVVGLLGPVLRRLAAARDSQLRDLHACLDRIEQKIDQHIVWHLEQRRNP